MCVCVCTCVRVCVCVCVCVCACVCVCVCVCVLFDTLLHAFIFSMLSSFLLLLTAPKAYEVCLHFSCSWQPPRLTRSQSLTTPATLSSTKRRQQCFPSRLLLQQHQLVSTRPRTSVQWVFSGRVILFNGWTWPCHIPITKAAVWSFTKCITQLHKSTSSSSSVQRQLTAGFIHSVSMLSTRTNQWIFTSLFFVSNLWEYPPPPPPRVPSICLLHFRHFFVIFLNPIPQKGGGKRPPPPPPWWSLKPKRRSVRDWLRAGPLPLPLRLL